jgi:hypothetical protein
MKDRHGPRLAIASEWPSAGRLMIGLFIEKKAVMLVAGSKTVQQSASFCTFC